MKLKLDISNIDFVDSNIVDFYDSKTIFFEPTNELPETVSFRIWGADIERDFKWEEHLNISDFPNIENILNNKEGRFTIKGFATLTFENVIGGEISISPYDKGNVVKLKNGETQTFRREWNLDKVDNSCFKYWFDTSIYFPYGACDLKIYSKGKVWFEFNPKDCVNYLDYITDKNRNETFWGYLSDKELGTNSIKYENIAPEK
ncbi:hypothetical protein [Lacinutrix sp. MEBiC02595]